MKRKLIAVTTALAALAGMCVSVNANPIVGSVGFVGNYTQNGGTSGNLSTANSLSLYNISVSPPAESGVLLGSVLISYLSPIGVNANVNNTIGQQLWQVMVGPTTYSFNVSSVVETLGAGNTTLTLEGSGTLSDGTPADNTLGTWTLAFGVSGAALTWNSTTANAPDGGATVMLLGAALSAMGLLRRKLMA